MKNYFYFRFQELILFLRLKYLVFLLFTYIVYILVKLPINSFISLEIDFSFIAFLIALMVSLVITKLKNKLFSRLFQRIKHDHILNSYLLDILEYYYSIIPHMFNVVYYHGFQAGNPMNTRGTMPQPSDAMIRQLGQRYHYLIRRHNIYIRIIDRLEPVASAMRRNPSDPKHMPLANVFEEQVRDAKSEIQQINARTLYDPKFYLYGRMWETTEISELTSLSVWTRWF